MSILRIADTIPAFRDGAPLSPTALNILRDNLLALDEATRLGGAAFFSGYGQPPEENDEQFQVVWRGGGVVRTGVTTLRLTTYTTGTLVAGDVIRVYRGDTDASGALPATYNDFALSSGTQTHTVTLSGYADAAVLRVIIELRHAANPSPPYTGARVQVVLAEFTPYALADAAPTLPTFSGPAAITAANLGALSDYILWLIRRVSLRYDPLAIVNVRRNGPFCIPGYGTQQDVIWRGGWRRTTAHTTLVVRGLTMRVWGGATETIALRINGSQVASTTVPTGVGESPWSLSASLTGYSVGAVLRIEVQYTRSAPQQDGTPINRWTINEVVAEAPAGGAISLSAWSIRQTGVTGASLASWLETAKGYAATIAQRITENGGLWTDQRLYAMRSHADAGQNALFEEWAVPGAFRRAGEALVGRGKALSLGYGAGYFDEAAYAAAQKGGTGIGAYPIKSTRTHPVVDGDDVESFQLYLDSAPALPPGAPYNVRGAESYVLMERLKVVE